MPTFITQQDLHNGIVFICDAAIAQVVRKGYCRLALDNDFNLTESAPKFALGLVA